MNLVLAYLMGCPIRGVILDPFVALRMGIQGQVQPYLIFMLYCIYGVPCMFYVYRSNEVVLFLSIMNITLLSQNFDLALHPTVLLLWRASGATEFILLMFLNTVLRNKEKIFCYRVGFRCSFRTN
jgi:hypothetical protein